MSGPEHYREAERLLRVADSPAGVMAKADGVNCAELAQVHATLALTAATVAARILSPQQEWGGHDITLAVADDWAGLL